MTSDEALKNCGTAFAAFAERDTVETRKALAQARVEFFEAVAREV